MNQHPSSIKDKELVGSRHTQKGEANHDTARAHLHLVRCGDVLRFKWSLPIEPFPLTLVRQVANLQRRLQFQQCLQSKSFRPLFAPNLSCLNLICPSRRTKSFRNAQGGSSTQRYFLIDQFQSDVLHRCAFPTVPVFHRQGTLCSRKTMRAELQRPFTCASGMFTNFPGLPPFTSKHLSTMSFSPGE